MPKINKKELDKFMKANPNAPATQAIKAQLEEITPSIQNVNNSPGLASESTQIRSSDSYLAASQINQLHRYVLEGFLDICHKAIEIGQILTEQKKTLDHGYWIDWIDDKLDIGPRQVENYLKIYHERKKVLESMNSQIDAGVKPSIRKMLLAASSKDGQSQSDYEKQCQKASSRLTSREKKERRKDEKRENEILTIAQMYIANEVDDNSLRALVLKWNRDNTDNYELFVEEVLEQVRQIEKAIPETANRQPSDRMNVMLSIDADLWDSFVHFGGRETYLHDYINGFIENYVIEQKSFRIAN